jgi:hypothetical protein
MIENSYLINKIPNVNRSHCFFLIFIDICMLDGRLHIAKTAVLRIRINEMTPKTYLTFKLTYITMNKHNLI